VAKHYQYILLDWDGNLANTLDLWMAATRSVLARHGHYPDDQTLGASLGHFEVAFARLGVENPRAAINDIRDEVTANLPQAPLYPDALEVLQHLKSRGKNLALVTTGWRPMIDAALQHHELTGLFDIVITGDDVTHHKPHAEPLQKALAALGGIKDQAIMIGDTEKDIGSAHNAGIDSILFLPPQHAPFYDFEDMLAHRPTHAITDFRDIMGLIA